MGEARRRELAENFNTLMDDIKDELLKQGFADVPMADGSTLKFRMMREPFCEVCGVTMWRARMGGGVSVSLCPNGCVRPETFT